MPVKLVEAQEALVRIEGQQEAVKEELAKPFALESDLTEKELKLAEINTQLNIGNEDVAPETVDEADIDEGGVSATRELAMAKHNAQQILDIKLDEPISEKSTKMPHAPDTEKSEI